MNFTIKLASAGIVTALMSSTALAGGLARGSANLDGLFGDQATLNTGVTYVSPGRSYNKVQGTKVVGGTGALLTGGTGEFSQNYIVPYFSVGGRLGGNTNCVASYAQPYGAHSINNGDLSFHQKEQKLETDEYGLTCAIGTELSKGSLMFIGGVFYEQLNFFQSRSFTEALGVVGDSEIDVSSEDWGYRIGLGYEIPEIALKASLLYRSATNHDLDGSFENTPFLQLAVGNGIPPAIAAAIYGANTEGDAYGKVTMPQSVEMKLQSGINQTTLAFGSIKWTDWSVLTRVGLNDGYSDSEFTGVDLYYRDGWTVSGGIAKRLNEQLAVTASLTWDRGVSTGWDTLSTTWAVSGGAAFDVSENMQIRAGGAAIYFTEADKTKVDPTASTSYTASSPSEWGYAASISAVLKF